MTSQYIAECYVTFADLLASEGEQVIMNLSRPEYTGKCSKSNILLNEYNYTYIFFSRFFSLKSLGVSAR